MINQIDKITVALQYISPDDRDLWVTIGMAIKSELGEEGFAIWINWSSKSDYYIERDAIAVWRSIRPRQGGIGIGTLFYYAKQNGWDPKNKETAFTVKRSNTKRDYADLKTAEETEEELYKKAQKAAEEAQIFIEEADYETHPYLTNKGFEYKHEDYSHKGERGFVKDGNLIIPMRLYTEYHKRDSLRAVQIIKPDGSKKFFPKYCRVALTCYLLGGEHNNKTATKWLVEGYATGLSIREALDAMHFKKDIVVVCFSSHNLKTIANHYITNLHNSILISERDKFRCLNKECRHTWIDTSVDSQLKEKRFYTKELKLNCPNCGDHNFMVPAGIKTILGSREALSWWLPPEEGDANDFHQKYGIEKLQMELHNAYNKMLENQQKVFKYNPHLSMDNIQAGQAAVT